MLKLSQAGLFSVIITPCFCVYSGAERPGVQPTCQTMWFFTESMIANWASMEGLEGLSRAVCWGVGDLSSGTKLPEHKTLTRQEFCDFKPIQL